MNTTEKKTKKESPIFSNGIMADGFSKGELNKVNAQGVFSTFWAWNFPAQRRWSIILTISNLSVGDHMVEFYLRKKGNKTLKKIGYGIIQNPEGEQLAILPVTLACDFKSDGIYELVSQFAGGVAQGVITFEVKQKDWPSFTQEELVFARTSKAHIIQSIRANIHCKSCSHAYIFEETILPETRVSPGVIRFPDNGVYVCKKCGHKLLLKDIQGQIRASLKEQLNNIMGGK